MRMPADLYANSPTDARVIALVEEQLANRNWGILSTQGYVLGIDLGVYGLRAALIDMQQQTFASAYAEVQSTNPHAMTQDALALAHDLLAEYEVSLDKLLRVGVGFGGPVDTQRGEVRVSPRMDGWEGFRLRDKVEQAFDTVTLLENDANLIALGEAFFGVGKDRSHLFYLHLSSGVGGGLVVQDRLYQGSTDIAGEIGHAAVIPTPPDQPIVTLEQIASVQGLLQRVRAAGLETDNLRDVFSDHPIAQQVVAETADLLGLRLAQVSATVDPQMIVLGGIIIRISGDAFITQIAAHMHRYHAPHIAHPLPVVASVLGADSVAVGALALALSSLGD